MRENPNPSPTHSGGISRTVPAGLLPVGAHAGRYPLSLLSARVGQNVTHCPPTTALREACHSDNEEEDLSAAVQQALARRIALAATLTPSPPAKGDDF